MPTARLGCERLVREAVDLRLVGLAATRVLGLGGPVIARIEMMR
jgi:hypothetical protein